MTNTNERMPVDPFKNVEFAPEWPTKCAQPDRDKEALRKFAERYAIMALQNLPDDYQARKRIITSAIVAALTGAELRLEITSGKLVTER